MTKKSYNQEPINVLNRLIKFAIKQFSTHLNIPLNPTSYLIVTITQNSDTKTYQFSIQLASIEKDYQINITNKKLNRNHQNTSSYHTRRHLEKNFFSPIRDLSTSTSIYI